jgi:hypothetical protein
MDGEVCDGSVRNGGEHTRMFVESCRIYGIVKTAEYGLTNQSPSIEASTREYEMIASRVLT